jgi:hypothetical protein
MPDFADVAQTLARGGDPPEWVVPVLTRVGELIGVRDDDDRILERDLFGCAKYLDTWLPLHIAVYDKLGLEDEVPECIYAVLEHLPDLIKFLEADYLAKPDNSRRLCAATCAEIWRTLHGSIQSSSVYLQSACDEYWRACGQPPIGELNAPRNWERNLKWAKSADDQGFRSWIEQLRLSHTKPASK